MNSEYVTYHLQIIHLETQAQLYISQNSLLRTRLNATLDELNTIHTSYNLQIASETCAKKQLSRKLDRYIDFVQDAEAERDDLRDVVNELIEKGGGTRVVEQFVLLLISTICSPAVQWL